MIFNTGRRYLLPITSSQFSGLSSPHIFHDLLDAPRFIFVSLGIIRLEARLVFHLDALLHAGDCLFVILVRVRFRIVRPNPLGELGCCAARVELDFVPVCVLEQFRVGESKFLSARVTDEPECRVSFSLQRMSIASYLNRMCARTDCGIFSLPPICRHEAIEMASSMACVAPFPEAGR